MTATKGFSHEQKDNRRNLSAGFWSRPGFECWLHRLASNVIMSKWPYLHKPHFPYLYTSLLSGHEYYLRCERPKFSWGHTVLWGLNRIGGTSFQQAVGKVVLFSPLQSLWVSFRWKIRGNPSPRVLNQSMDHPVIPHGLFFPLKGDSPQGKIPSLSEHGQHKPTFVAAFSWKLRDPEGISVAALQTTRKRVSEILWLLRHHLLLPCRLSLKFLRWLTLLVSLLILQRQIPGNFSCRRLAIYFVLWPTLKLRPRGLGFHTILSPSDILVQGKWEEIHGSNEDRV